ncbi:glycogenin-2 [Denticeps clupeoides]|uniref:glycogenin-2 n=1 Tax=Denticeps clupeoides TaxID=299321 RepID=UPI0010A50398|nr:glycogenin-2 [Denticeps clupeoides]
MGALVMGKSLRRHGTTRKIVVLISSSVSPEARHSLERVFDEVVQVDVMDSMDRTHLSWLGRPELGVTLTKLQCWMLIKYKKCVFLDADTLVLQNVDDLFEREELSAAPDAGWPDCFNSGVFVFRPSLHTHSRLLAHAAHYGCFDGGDQGLLNSFFKDWAVKDISKHLPFVYNLSSSAIYTYLPAFQTFGHQAKIVHFLGAVKPWHLRYDQSNKDSYLDQFLNMWWAEYRSQMPPISGEVDGNQDSGDMLHPSPVPASPTPLQIQARGTEVLPPEVRTPRPLHPPPPPPPIDLTIHVPTQPEATFAVGEVKDCWTPASELEDGSMSSAGACADPINTETAEESLHHRRMWEKGHVDYMGKDSFENIKKKLDIFLD